MFQISEKKKSLREKSLLGREILNLSALCILASNFKAEVEQAEREVDKL